jgi:carbamoyltransferase
MADRHMTGRTLVIGANFWNHDSAIFGIDVENQRAFGMATERLTRYKHDTLPPVPAVRELLREWRIDGRTIERVVVATSLQSQLRWKVERGLYSEVSSLRTALGARYLKDVVSRLAEYEQLHPARRGRLLLKSEAGRRYLRNRLRGSGKCVPFRQMVSEEFSRLFPRAAVEVRAFDHHVTHAVSGLALSGFEDPLILTLDGWGDGFFSKAFIRSGNGLQEVSASPTIRSVGSPERNRLHGLVPAHILGTGIFDDLSLGHFYSIVTWLLGFEPGSDEGKVEALAAYAPPDNEFLEALRKTVALEPEHVRLVVSPAEAYSLYFDIGRLQDFVKRLGQEAVAAAAQRFLEERALGLVQLLLAEYPRSAIIFSGGCAANVVLNMHIYERLCPNIYVVPAMGDDGTALGAAVLALKQLGVSDGQLQFLKNMTLPYFGNQHPRSTIESALNRNRERISFEDRTADWPETVARFLHQGQIGAIYQGRMEWGPRALGNRSIVANPCLAETRHRINAVVKKRPLFQPFCPTILEEERERLFERAYVNRHMTCAFKMRKEFWNRLPSAIHIDGTARAQFLAAADNPMFYRVLAEFKRLSGFGVVINTSFNLHGRTIVNTPSDALDDFLDSQMDFLVLDGYLVRRRP